jgi:pimeloyl-ACP methyl ester carboxylesterase
MKRRWKVLIAIGIGLVALLIVNTIVVDSETKRAAITADGAKILRLPGGDLQVVDTAAKSPNPGAPIVLLPCYACSLHWYDSVVPLLERDHRVIAIDLLGEGGSAKPASGYSMESEAQLVAAALAKLRVQGAVVVGHSMGAAVATSLAQQASQLVDRLVIIDQAPDNSYGGTPFLAKLGYVPVLGEALRRIIFDSVVKDTYGAAFAPGYDISSGFQNPNQVVDDFRAMTYTSYADLAGGEDDFESAEGLDARIRSAAVPLMVIFGTEDQIWDKPDPETAANAYRSVPGAEIAMVKGAGHSPNVEKPAQTAALIREFAANPGDNTGETVPPNIGLGGNGGGKSAEGPSACIPPKTKSIRAAIRSPKNRALVGKSFLVHVVTTEPPSCQASVSLAVDGTPYQVGAPVEPKRPAGRKNPLATKALHLTGAKAKRRYAQTPSCTTARSSYFKLAAPRGPHVLRIAGCPPGDKEATTEAASVLFTVR